MERRYLRKLPKSVDELAHWYMRYISPVTLVGALFLDYFVLLRRVDLWIGNTLLFFYILVAASCITLMNLIQAGRLRHPYVLKVTPLIPVVAQFAFGGLFVGYLALYSRSAAIEITWIFILAIAALLIGNERFVRFYTRFVFQFSIFFTVLFSFLIFFLPVVFGRIGPLMFLTSGITSIILTWSFYYLLRYLVRERARAERTNVARSIAVIFITFNVLYFTGAIPPLPLALKDAGVYHGATRIDGEYRLLAESREWYEAYLRYNTVFNRAPGESACVFTAIFAPSGLSTNVLHEWKHYGELEERWVNEQTVPFFIVGGRDGGYRGYSVRSDPRAGKWRINVITEFGQAIGRVSFTVVEAAAPVFVKVVVR